MTSFPYYTVVHIVLIVPQCSRMYHIVCLYRSINNVIYSVFVRKTIRRKEKKNVHFQVLIYNLLIRPEISSYGCTYSYHHSSYIILYRLERSGVFGCRTLNVQLFVFHIKCLVHFCTRWRILLYAEVLKYESRYVVSRKLI